MIEALKKLVGVKCIVRCDRSGVLFGTIDEISEDGKIVALSNARKTFYWSGASAVEQMAVDGVKKPSDCKFTVIVEKIIVTDAIQILPMTQKAIASMEAVEVWKR